MSPKAMLLPVAMFTNLNSEPDLQGIAWLVARVSKLLEPTSWLCYSLFLIFQTQYLLFILYLIPLFLIHYSASTPENIGGV